MSITVACACGRSVSFRDDFLGQTRRCVYCEAPLRVGLEPPDPEPEPVIVAPLPSPAPRPPDRSIPWEDPKLTLASRWWRTWWHALVTAPGGDAPAPAPPPTRTCPHCTSTIDGSATTCPQCAEDVNRPPDRSGRPPTFAATAPPSSHDPGWPAELIVAIVCIGIITAFLMLGTIGALAGMAGAPSGGSDAERTGFMCGLALYPLLAVVYAITFIGLLMRKPWAVTLGTAINGTLFVLSGIGLVLGGLTLGLRSGGDGGATCGCIAALGAVVLAIFGVPMWCLMRVRDRL